MKKPLLAYITLNLALFAQPAAEQSSSVYRAPDPYAVHTPSGELLEQPILTGEDISILYFQLTCLLYTSDAADE